jgi:hypothetical protein
VANFFIANFNETEQIDTVASQADPNKSATTLSFVQIRQFSGLRSTLCAISQIFKSWTWTYWTQ